MRNSDMTLKQYNIFASHWIWHQILTGKNKISYNYSGCIIFNILVSGCALVMYRSTINFWITKKINRKARSLLFFGCVEAALPHCWVHKRSFPGAEFNWCVREQRRGDNYTSIILMEISHWERERDVKRWSKKLHYTTTNDETQSSRYGKHRERNWCPTAIKSRHKPRGEKMSGAVGFIFICTHKNPQRQTICSGLESQLTRFTVLNACSWSRCE